jgi:hypothetical protein
MFIEISKFKKIINLNNVTSVEAVTGKDDNTEKTVVKFVSKEQMIIDIQLSEFHNLLRTVAEIKTI